MAASPWRGITATDPLFQDAIPIITHGAEEAPRSLRMKLSYGLSSN
jgi:hypothetical protein